ncbi:3-hydroxy-3-methylglutaryl-coenzyme A reductase [Agrilus planipennis]|uniref:3-hydroxy-3-methylglutaryl coenzyme A reductase n=1 Tax=Agrilus planipennis TaxID=224129 RepID=A0A1W4X6G1_AGRPL|nr:3-hydroxy-3-methylglutaryl-coenzyme A reductase [Agrilus planipennis]
MASTLFYKHGEFCAAHPWEVIVAILTLTGCMFSVEQQYAAPLPKPPIRDCASCIQEAEYNAADLIVMTLIRCLAVPYSYYQFCILQKFGSKYIIGIAGLFTVCSSFVFTTTVINLLRFDVADIRDALFFFILLMDLSKAVILAQFALCAKNQDEIKNNIAKGMAILGPTVTLDAIVEALVISVGALSGVRRLEIFSGFACLSILVNYVIFMTFYPACLSLLLELSRTSSIYLKKEIRPSLIISALNEEDNKSNPIVRRVKLIMSVGLMLVHIHRYMYRWPSHEESIDSVSPFVVEQHLALNSTQTVTFHGYLMRWIALSADHIVILILLLALLCKFIFFENKEELVEQLRVHMNNQSLEFLNPNEHQNNHLNRTIRQRFIPTMPFFRSHSMFLDNVSLDNEEKDLVDKEVQTQNEVEILSLPLNNSKEVTSKNIAVLCPPMARSVNECLTIYKSDLGATTLTDEEVILLVKNKHIPPYQIEKAVDDPERGVRIRRQMIGKDGNFGEALEDLPYKNYDYTKVMGACCENVIGYMPIPVGIAGPLLLDGKVIYVPMATTEGCLVASTNRGSRALLKCGITSRVVADGMTRGPVVRFPSVAKASEVMVWMENKENFGKIKESFDASSRFARLKKIQVRIAGRYLFARFVATTGDAMGMNMLSKGTEMSLKFIQTLFPEMEILSISGNFCADKKPAAVNWIEGRGKSVVCEAVVPAEIVSTVLKTSTHALVDVNISKNMVGSAMAGSIGGFNAHAANVVTAIFIATGQDPAQNVGSSNCMTLMEPWGRNGEDLYISCTMPSVEVGTIGGGTVLPAQAACLEMLGVKGSHSECPGENANQLARVVCGTVLAGELSLMAALAAGHLVRSHLRHNRSSVAIFSEMEGNIHVTPPCKTGAYFVKT